MKQLIDLLVGRPGAGKTENMVKREIEVPGRYLFSCPRIDLIRERISDIQRHAAMQGVAPPIIEEAHSQTGGVETVARQLADAHGRHSNASHVVILTTHQALIETDFSAWAGWQVRIDEVPSGVKSHSWKARVAAFLLEAIYDLVPVDDHLGWWRIAPKPNCPALGAFMRDDFVAGLAELQKAVLSPQGAFTTVGDWSDLRGGLLTFEWVSIWTVHELRVFESCEIASAAYRHSLIHRVSEHIHPGKIELREHVIQPTKSSCASIDIIYFTRHRGSTHFWQNDPVGRECVTKVRDYLATQAVGYWATNHLMAPGFVGRLGGQQVSPRTEGTNALRHHQSCAFIYSAKRQPADGLLQRLIPELSDDVIERAREIEDIIQFVFRGAIRMADFAGDYRIYVYDVFQAEVLRDELAKMGLPAAVTVCAEAGIMDVVRGKSQRKPVDERSQAKREEEHRNKAAARMRSVRAADATAKKAAGTYKGPGRPKKEANNGGSPATP